MADVRERLLELADEGNMLLMQRTVPGLPPETFLGARFPALRRLAKEIYRSGEYEGFIAELPHFYHDENLLHAVIISLIPDMDDAMRELERFLPYVNSWAICDTLRPKPFAKHKAELMQAIRRWIRSSHTYTVRFGIGMLMCHFLDDDFTPECLSLAESVHSEEYYVNMMLAWYYATALAKQYPDTVKLIENGTLPVWVHNKTIQKACESYRVSDERKAYLKTLRKKTR